MKESKRTAKGVGRFWVAAAAIGGALAAFLADPVRGRARRQVAVDRTRTAMNAVADRTQQWQRAITSRVSRGSAKMTSLSSKPSESGPSRDAAEPAATPQPTRSTSEAKPPES